MVSKEIVTLRDKEQMDMKNMHAERAVHCITLLSMQSVRFTIGTHYLTVFPAAYQQMFTAEFG